MKKPIEIEKLIVNPDNYRFDPVDTQEQAIDLMLQEKGIEIFNLASDILNRGLDQARDFRVIKNGDLFLVLDGNRRTTALKCLKNTNLIKDIRLKERFDKLNIEIEKIPKIINAFVYNSEVEAASWIKLDHTGKNNGIGQDPWGAAEIDRFGYKFEGKISPAMQAVTFVEREKNKKFDTKKLKISTINRIFSNPISRSYLGIDIRDKKIAIMSSKKEVADRIDTLFEKIIKENIKVDEVYTKEKSLEFMKKIFKDKPQIKKTDNKINSKDTEAKQTPRTNKTEVIFFGKKLYLRKSETNNLYRDINDLYMFYEKNKKILSPSFCSLIRMSLRLIVESATSKRIDDYIESNFENAKKVLTQDQRTTISNYSITEKKLVQLLHTGAHKYSSSANIDQTIAMSFIIGAMLEITHHK